MGLFVDIVVDHGIEFGAVDELRRCLEYATVHETRAPRGEWDMTVRLTGDEAIAAIHDEFMSDPSPTDVISFPSGEPLTSRSGYLGDVVVSVDTARDQAQDAGHSCEREVAFLALHGFLHLCGYDDMDQIKRENMLQRQTALLEGFERECGTRG